MIERHTSQFGQAVSVVNKPEKIYGNVHLELRNEKGDFVGTLAVNGRGQVTLVSQRGYYIAIDELVKKDIDNEILKQNDGTLTV